MRRRNNLPLCARNAERQHGDERRSIMNEATKQALAEGRVVPITICADLSQCTFVPQIDGGDDDAADNDSQADRPG